LAQAYFSVNVFIQAVELERDSLSQQVIKLNGTIRQLENELRLHEKDRK